VKYFAVTPSHGAHLILECTNDKAGFAARNLDDQALGKLIVDI
jgi:hypothetical protein